MKKLLGSTYDHKDAIRAQGGQWNAKEKAWYVSAEKYEELQEEIYPNFRKIQAEARIPKPCGEKTKALVSQYEAMDFAILEMVSQETQQDFILVYDDWSKIETADKKNYLRGFESPILSEVAEKLSILSAYVFDYSRDFEASGWSSPVGAYENEGEIFDTVTKKFEHFCDKEILRRTWFSVSRSKIEKKKLLLAQAM